MEFTYESFNKRLPDDKYTIHPSIQCSVYLCSAMYIYVYSAKYICVYGVIYILFKDTCEMHSLGAQFNLYICEVLCTSICNAIYICWRRYLHLFY